MFYRKKHFSLLLQKIFAGSYIIEVESNRTTIICYNFSADAGVVIATIVFVSKRTKIERTLARDKISASWRINLNKKEKILDLCFYVAAPTNSDSPRYEDSHNNLYLRTAILRDIPVLWRHHPNSWHTCCRTRCGIVLEAWDTSSASWDQLEYFYSIVGNKALLTQYSWAGWRWPLEERRLWEPPKMSDLGQLWLHCLESEVGFLHVTVIIIVAPDSFVQLLNHSHLNAKT